MMPDNYSQEEHDQWVTNLSMLVGERFNVPPADIMEIHVEPQELVLKHRMENNRGKRVVITETYRWDWKG